MGDIDPIRKALQKSPDDVPLLLRLGQVCLDEWSFDEARDAFSRVLSMEPGNVDARLGTANLLILDGSTSEAIVRLESLVHDHPKHSRGWLLLARAHLHEGDTREARRAYRQARELEPGLSDPGLERDLGPQPRPSGSETAAAQMTGSPLDDDPFGPPFDDASDPFEEEEAFTPEDLERPAETFASVFGLEDAKRALSLAFVGPLSKPDIYRTYGRQAGGGVLLYGPPGCGKSLIARAVAGEAGAAFLDVRPHQLLDMYIGNSEKNLNQVFQLARENTPTVLFFDEVEALATDRKEARSSLPRSVIQQFLTELDRRQKDGDPILVIAATNAPWMIDAAFRRPGRFDHIVAVAPPDQDVREAILRHLLAGKPVADLDFAAVARAAEGFSGADLRMLCNRAVDSIIPDAIARGTTILIETDTLLNALNGMTPAFPEWRERSRRESSGRNRWWALPGQ